MNTDKLFENMRQAPVDIPLEKVEQFVIANAAAGTFAAAAKTGLLKRFALKFHLNSIFVLVSLAIAATAIIFFSLNGKSQNLSSKNPVNEKNKFSLVSNSQNHNPVLVNDSPAVNQSASGTSVVIYTSGDSVSTSKTTDANGSKITIHSNRSDLKVIIVPDSLRSDSNQTIAYAASSGNLQNMQSGFKAAHNHADGSQTAAGDSNGLNKLNALNEHTGKACNSDLLEKVLRDELIKDGIIEPGEYYRFELTGKYMTVNGKRKDNEKYVKYKALIENNSTFVVTRKFSYIMWVTSNGVSIKISN